MVRIALIGAHPMYLSTWLLGAPISIVSLFSHHYGREVEDNASSIIEFENHILVSAESSLVASRADMVFELYGTTGWFKYSGRPSRVKDVRLERMLTGWLEHVRTQASVT